MSSSPLFAPTFAPAPTASKKELQAQKSAPSTCPSCAGGDNASAARKGDASCPTRMADGRLFTDYRPRCDIAMQFAAPMTGSYEYRQWMLRNGARVMDHQRMLAYNGAKCSPCSQPSTMPKDKARFVCDKVACARVPTTQFDSPADRMRAFGTGRDYTGATSK